MTLVTGVKAVATAKGIQVPHVQTTPNPISTVPPEQAVEMHRQGQLSHNRVQKQALKSVV